MGDRDALGVSRVPSCFTQAGRSVLDQYRNRIAANGPWKRRSNSNTPATLS